METLTCKKELIGTRIYRVNKKYEIYKFDKFGYDYLNSKNLFILTEEYNDKFSANMIGIGQWFGSTSPHKIFDYFYTEKELRKLKLKKLNEKMPDL
jgi:hypothetical protein